MTDDNPLVEGVDYYYNDDGLMILTAKFLTARGFCCHNACKHCPYTADLLVDKKNND